MAMSYAIKLEMYRTILCIPQFLLRERERERERENENNYTSLHHGTPQEQFPFWSMDSRYTMDAP